MSEPYDLFKQRYESLAGRVYHATSWAESVKLVNEICSACRAKVVVVSSDFANPFSDSFDLGEHLDYPVLAHEAETENLIGTISDATVGITSAQFAIAFTGTIVEVSTNDLTRLISSLPPVHIAFLPRSQILNSLDAASTRMSEIYATHSRNCNITFISGPSRTADIEMRLFLGVHGPKESHVIICDW